MVSVLAALSALFSAVMAGYIPPGPRHPCPQDSTVLYPCSCTAGTDQGLYLSCRNTNLASLAVAITNVAAFNAPVVELKVIASSFSRLYGDLLYAIDVYSLVIQDTPITDIEDQTFLGINRTLSEIHLLNTSLAQFPTQAFQVLGGLKVLNVKGHKIKALQKDSLRGALQASLQRFSLTNGELTDVAPDTFSSCKKLKRLDLHGNNMTRLQKNQFKGLRDLEILDLSYNQLSKVDASHLGDLNKLTWLNLSHNALDQLARGAFARNTVLRSLNLSHNRLKKLDSNSLRGMRFIRRLYLSDNNISEIGRDTFGAVSRIGTIDLARNKLKKIDYQMFSQLQYAEVIDVSDNQVTEIEKLAFKDLYLVHINLSHNSISKIHEGAFENCANITVLDLSHNNISNFSPRSFDDVTYASTFHLAYNHLTDLSQVPIANMTGLKVLNVTFNNLMKIPRNTFPKLYELHTVDLSHNDITEIFNGVFQTLYGLRFLNLSYNSMSEIRTSTLATIPTLLDLDLSFNQIESVSRGGMTRLGAIQRLHMSHNFLERIFEVPVSLTQLDLSYNNISSLGDWPTMNSLLRLNLSRNHLEDSLEGGSLANLLTLQILDLSHNNISLPPWQALSDLSSLQYLHLQNNHISSLGKGAFGRLPVVFELNLARNQISNVSVKAFDGLLQLIKLDLSYNLIQHIPNGAFHGLVSLNTLDLSHNYLESVDNKTNGIFEDCLSLEKISLSHNLISYVTRKSFPSNPYIPYKLKELDLSFNTMPALTYDITFGTKTLRVLNVSNNMINEVRKGVIGNLTSLEILDLSSNEISDLSGLESPPSFAQLYVQNNILSTLPIKALRKLSLLDVSNNLLDYYTEVTTMVTNKSTVLYQGNQINCDCRLRPLRRWLLSESGRIGPWEDVTCHLPSSLAGQRLLSIPESSLSCPGLPEKEEFDTTPDLKFRDLTRNKNGRLVLTWYVTTKEDVADFDLIIRDKAREGVLMKKHFPYNTRSVAFTRIPSRSRMDLELCVIGLNSKGEERVPHNLQCRLLPSSASYIYLASSSVLLLLIPILLYLT